VCWLVLALTRKSPACVGNLLSEVRQTHANPSPTGTTCCVRRHTGLNKCPLSALLLVRITSHQQITSVTIVAAQGIVGSTVIIVNSLRE
jgi:hypothetical protein